MFVQMRRKAVGEKKHEIPNIIEAPKANRLV